MAQINLLPWREELREARKREYLVILGGVAIVSALVWFLIHFMYSEWIEYQNYRNTLLTQEIAVLDKKITEIKDLKKLKESLIVRMGIIQELQANRPRVVHLFDEVVNVLPKGVYFSSLGLQGNELTLDGVAVSNTNISQLMRNIGESSWIQNPVLKEIKTTDDDGQQTSVFSLKSDFTSPEARKK